ncbi:MULTISPECIES: DUF1127 domain-containing protein [unclassified Leisingera]|uniref:DUF1127 domain-containing protein n=1 Tax=unclassified Leisingera TaxID=2614906 RepID=UPI00101193F0|nr:MULTISPECIES: DUF1127 domain-containing protein [unclassified Leisingera]MCF6429570.1 DUF1127 domain-containing protein [Leisingera sp. MMG026]QAX31489.1 DUF1127 domain-containing protein [Leisingera sp. NJS204]
MTTANIYAPLGAVTVLRVVDTLINVKTALVEWNESRETRKALARLSDAQLEDIGMNRADIANI